jgi:uncharacterized membrane protein
MVTATLALIGFFVALYLWLWRIGFLGALACGSGGGCEAVQLSEYGEFLGIPVALYGMVGYAAILAVSLAGLTPRWIDRREPTVVLASLAAVGVLVTLYLTYLEAAVIGAWCRWCLVSAGIIVAILVAAVVGLVRVGGGGRLSPPSSA